MECIQFNHFFFSFMLIVALQFSDLFLYIVGHISQFCFKQLSKYSDFRFVYFNINACLYNIALWTTLIDNHQT